MDLSSYVILNATTKLVTGGHVARHDVPDGAHVATPDVFGLGAGATVPAPAMPVGVNIIHPPLGPLVPVGHALVVGAVATPRQTVLEVHREETSGTPTPLGGDKAVDVAILDVTARPRADTAFAVTAEMPTAVVGAALLIPVVPVTATSADAARVVVRDLVTVTVPVLPRPVPVADETATVPAPTAARREGLLILGRAAVVLATARPALAVRPARGEVAVPTLLAVPTGVPVPSATTTIAPEVGAASTRPSHGAVTAPGRPLATSGVPVAALLRPPTAVGVAAPTQVPQPRPTTATRVDGGETVASDAAAAPSALHDVAVLAAARPAMVRLHAACERPALVGPIPLLDYLIVFFSP